MVDRTPGTIDDDSTLLHVRVVSRAEAGRAGIVECDGVSIIKDMHDRFEEENVSYYAQALLTKLGPYDEQLDET